MNDIEYDKPKICLNKSCGFTLIEILVVVVILSVLAAVIMPNVMDKPEEARVAKARNDIKALEAALDMYKLDNFAYPNTEQGLEALVTPPVDAESARRWRAGGYIKRLEKDPWGQDYQYLSPGVRGTVDIYSLGPDGVPGNDDIGNWQ